MVERYNLKAKRTNKTENRMENEMFQLWNQPPLENLAVSTKPRKFYVICGEIKTAIMANTAEKAAILALTNHSEGKIREALKNSTAEVSLLRLEYAQNAIVSESGFVSPQENKDFWMNFKENNGREMCMDLEEFSSFWKKSHSEDIKFSSKNLIPEIIISLSKRGLDLGGQISPDNKEDESDEY